MLSKINILFFALLTFQTSWASEYLKFDHEVSSNQILPECSVVKGDENGIFSLTYKDEKKTHAFYIMKGIPTSTCRDHVIAILKIKKKFKKINISGDRGHTNEDNPNEIIWTFKFVKAGNFCDGHPNNYCYPHNHPGKMY
jgi:hypothetical protein